MSTLLTIEHNPESGWFLVRAGDRFEQCSRDEALWAVANWLRDDTVPYLRTYEEHMAKPWRKDETIAGLLTHQETPA